MTAKISPWALGAIRTFNDAPPALFSLTKKDFVYKVYYSEDSVLIDVRWPNGGKLILRPAYLVERSFRVDMEEVSENGLKLVLSSPVGTQTVTINFAEAGVICYKTTLTPVVDVALPYTPRDLIVPVDPAKPEGVNGKVHFAQIGSRSGMVFFSQTRPASGSILYCQDLTALGEFCEQTDTSLDDTVGGEWPELGFKLPETIRPLKAGTAVIISDARVIIHPRKAENEVALIRQYLEMLGKAYLLLDRPQTSFKNWQTFAQGSFEALTHNKGCWVQHNGQQYLNAYVSDYDTPPEIMVQLAVLMPVIEYLKYEDIDTDIVKRIKDGLPAFYDEQVGTIVRWLPSQRHKLQGEEEQKKPLVMDAWYLHHPLANLGRLALSGDKDAENLFLGSMDFTIKVARHFKYKWPVFYKMETLEVVKAETEPGKGGEKDVPGLYAHVMLLAYELTGDKEYFREAKKALLTLRGLGFELFYQGNNTTFSAKAALRLYKITGDNEFLEISYLCLANVMKNVRLWDCNYGLGKDLPYFFAVFPLNDAPYTAAYEEMEIFSAFHQYLDDGADVEILPALKMLLSEFIKYLVDRAVFYYPRMVPEDLVEKDTKTGEIDLTLDIPLEDMYDGRKKWGCVGQEVYGAGLAFSILPRHFRKINNGLTTLYIDYPVTGFRSSARHRVSFHTGGDERLNCTMLLMQQDQQPRLKNMIVRAGRKEVAGRVTDAGLQYILPGNTAISVSWK